MKRQFKLRAPSGHFKRFLADASGEETGSVKKKEWDRVSRVREGERKKERKRWGEIE